MVAKLDGVSKSYGALNIFSGFDFEINKGEKFAIVGPNGAGKSTFCRLITGQEEADAGTHTFGHKVATSFFSQNHADELDPESHRARNRRGRRLPRVRPAGPQCLGLFPVPRRRRL
jgi:ATP-binding cassette, subfamily F, member 3